MKYFMWCPMVLRSIAREFFALSESRRSKNQISHQPHGLGTALLCCLAFAMSAQNSMAGQIIMGTGTEWGHWRGALLIDSVKTLMTYHQILHESLIPTQLEKTYLNGNTDMSHFQDLLDHGVSPVMLEENQLQQWYHESYPSGNDWDASHVWNDSIQAKADRFLASTIAMRVENMKKMDFHGLNMYYVLNPEFNFIGDSKTSPDYANFVLKEIEMLRSANLPGLKIIRGFLVIPGVFNNYLGTTQKYAQSHTTELSKVDYFGPEFHNQESVDSTRASEMITFLKTIRSYTGKRNFIPSSYIRWDSTSDDSAVGFWNYLHAHRDQLENEAGVVAWCLSATLEDRGGTGLVEPSVRPTDFTGYVYPFGKSGTYNHAGIAFLNWLRDESPYQIINVNSGLALQTDTSGYLVQNPPISWQADQKWVLVQLNNGYCLIKNKQTGLVLGVENSSTADNEAIVEAAYSGQWNAMWMVDGTSDGPYTIINRKSGRHLSIAGGSTSPGARLVQHSAGNNSELWSFNIDIPANSICMPTAMTPYLQIDGGAWQRKSFATIKSGQSIKLSPQPKDSGSWSWDGPNGYSASKREIAISNMSKSDTGDYVATYTNSTGCKGGITFNISLNESASAAKPHDAFDIEKAYAIESSSKGLILKLRGFDGKSAITICNLKGAPVYRATSIESTIHIPDLSSGLYILEIKNDNFRLNGKFVK